MTWTHTLYTKLALGLVIILLMVGLLYTLSLTYLAEHWQQSATQQINRHLAKNLVDDNRIVHAGKIDKEAMKKTFMAYMTINPSIEIYFLDLDGNILSYSAEPGKVKRDHVSLLPIQQFLDGHITWPLLGDDPRSVTGKKIFSVTPLPDSRHPQGYLYVVLQGENLSAAQQTQAFQYIRSVAMPGLLGSLALGFLIGLIIFRRLTLRLRRLQKKVNDFSLNGYQQPSPFAPVEASRSHDEIDELEQRFFQMSQHIGEQWSALKQQDQLRREMIASISHDLRTPLASAQGYLETIALKHEALSDEEKKHYLDIAISQTHRLQSLIDQLFELVKLEAHDTKPRFEDFSILELVYDVVNKFALKAQKKNIHIQVAPDAEDLRVVADIGLIERVLDNLLDNALQYTSENKKIEIEVKLDGQKTVTISVKDEGKGISSDQTTLIFERFHRADNPQRSSTGHAGLGLAIVKRIIELHKQTIWVESEPGRGARFSFTLARAG
ncbi:MAG: ATP-binding protein [Thiotrichales bacterium]